MLFWLFNFLFILLTLSLSYISKPSIILVLSVSSAILVAWFVTNKGHILIALLTLEGASATLVPMVVLSMASLNSSSTIIFIFIVVIVCEACMGLACLLSFVRLPLSMMSKSSFFTN